MEGGAHRSVPLQVHIDIAFRLTSYKILVFNIGGILNAQLEIAIYVNTGKDTKLVHMKLSNKTLPEHLWQLVWDFSFEFL